jgi:hypothetical protein
MAAERPALVDTDGGTIEVQSANGRRAENAARVIGEHVDHGCVALQCREAAVLIIIREEQSKALSEATFGRYMDSLMDKISASQRQTVVGNGGLRRAILAAIEHAESLGFVREDQVTPFVLLSITLGASFAASPLTGWLSAVAEATEYAPEHRMDAIYALMSESDRSFYFQV